MPFSLARSEYTSFILSDIVNGLNLFLDIAKNRLPAPLSSNISLIFFFGTFNSIAAAYIFLILLNVSNLFSLASINCPTTLSVSLTGSPDKVPSYINFLSSLSSLLNSCILKFKVFSGLIGTTLNPNKPASSSVISYSWPFNVWPSIAFPSLLICGTEPGDNLYPASIKLLETLAPKSSLGFHILDPSSLVPFLTNISNAVPIYIDSLIKGSTSWPTALKIPFATPVSTGSCSFLSTCDMTVAGIWDTVS